MEEGHLHDKGRSSAPNSKRKCSLLSFQQSQSFHPQSGTLTLILLFPAPAQFPGPLLQQFHNRAEAERFLAKAGRFSSQPAKKDDADSEDELAERTRIFTGLDPNSELARRRSTGMSAERREAQRKSRMHFAMHPPILAQDVTLLSPPLSLCSKLSDDLPISPSKRARVQVWALHPPLSRA